MPISAISPAAITAMRVLDDALFASGAHPLLVPAPVKLTVIQLAKKLGRAGNQDAAFADVARLLAYCILGHEQFGDSNGAEETERADDRFEIALEKGDTLDAKLILLALHAGLIAPEIADRIGLEEP